MTDKSPAGWNGAFVVGTGRCGSTLVTRALALHPDVLSLSEFFIAMPRDAFPPGTISGKEFWDLITTQDGFPNKLFSIGAEPPEFLYPVDAGLRFNRASGVPRISIFTLPALSEDPDALYDQLADTVPSFGEQPAAQHYRELFALLGTLQNRPQWVERSGAAGFVAGNITTAFPTARYVHLTRETDPTARSMSRHSAFRLIALWLEFINQCDADLFHGEPPAKPIPPDLAHLTYDQLTKESFDHWNPDLDHYRRIISLETDSIRAALAPLPAHQVLTVSYEDLLDDPAGVFTKMAEFFELADPAGWAQQAATLVRR